MDFLIFYDSDAWFLKPFKKNFKHVAIVLHCDVGGILIDPRSSKTEIEVITPKMYDDIATPSYTYMVRDGAKYTIIRCKKRREIKRLQFPAFYTCVEEAKRILGIRAWWVVTPWQLYKYVRRVDHGS